MAKEATQAKEVEKAKRVRVSQTDVPAYSLEDALRVASAIADNYASSPTKPLEVAAAMNLAPSSSHFKMLTGSAIAYGLTTGGYNAVEISLTPLANRILSPLEEGDDLIAKREALLTPNIVGQFLTKYNNSPLPPQHIALNVLTSMGVPKERGSSVYQLIIDGAGSLGLIQEIKSKKYINLQRLMGPSLSVKANETLSVISNENASEEDESADSLEHFVEKFESKYIEQDQQKTPNKKVFITHGHNKNFVEPIKKLLSFGEMEAVVSVEKQSVSQPVPDKVMNDMRDCGAAIIHVEGEMNLIDADAKEHVVLNPNVLIEIGAAMALYKKRFILLVKDGVKLPSNLQGLYEVRYDGDTLDGNATIRLLEAINELKKMEA